MWATSATAARSRHKGVRALDSRTLEEAGQTRTFPLSAAAAMLDLSHKCAMMGQ